MTPELKEMFDREAPKLPWYRSLKYKIFDIGYHTSKHITKLYNQLMGIQALEGAACKCLKCKSINYGYRVGCNCWPTDDIEILISPNAEYQMEYGQYTEGGGFISLSDIRVAIEKGAKFVDENGKRVTLVDFEESDEA